MTIFHAIKFADVEIDNDDQLKILPAEVVRAWRNRVLDYAVEQALTCVHMDETGTAQGCIDAIADYRAGKITEEELVKIADSYAAYAAAHASTYSTYAAYAASYSAYSRHAQASRGAGRATYYARLALGMNPDWYQVQAEDDILFKKWLVEELMNFDSKVTPDHLSKEEMKVIHKLLVKEGRASANPSGQGCCWN